MYICINTYLSIYIYVHICICEYVYMYICIHLLYKKRPAACVKKKH